VFVPGTFSGCDVSRAGVATVAVLDNDPTGTQTVAGVPVLTSSSVADLRWAIVEGSRSFFVLTNATGQPGAGAAASPLPPRPRSVRDWEGPR
jgi:hypothetical protein